MLMMIFPANDDIPSNVEDNLLVDINTSQHGHIRGFTHRIKSGNTRNTVNHGGPFYCTNQVNMSAQQIDDVMTAMQVVLQNPELAANLPPDLLERIK